MPRWPDRSGTVWLPDPGTLPFHIEELREATVQGQKVVEWALVARFATEEEQIAAFSRLDLFAQSKSGERVQKYRKTTDVSSLKEVPDA